MRAYLGAERTRARLMDRANAVFEGFWLGALSPRQLAELDAVFFETVKERHSGGRDGYTDAAWNEQGLFDWEAQAVERHFPATGRIVVTSAGAGREVLALARAGYEAIGYEPNERLREAGERMLAARGLDDRLHHSPRDRFPEGVPDCDALIVGWASYALIAGRDRRVELLRAAGEPVARGGPILISFFVRADSNWYPGQVHAYAAALRRILRRPPLELGDALSPNFLHRFTRAELESEVTEAGLRIVSFADSPYGHAILEAA